MRKGNPSKRSIHVGRDGRLVIPKDVVAAEALAPGDEVDVADVRLRRKGMTRRAFIRSAGTFLTFAAAGQTYSWFASQAREVSTAIDKSETELMDRLFGPRGAPSVALAPAGAHPFKSPETPLGFYPTDLAVCDAYRGRFLKKITEIRRVHGYPQIRTGDHLIVAGAQVSNIITRTLLGNPWKMPQFHIEQPAWRTEIPWNVWIDGEERWERRQFNNQWLGFNEVIVDPSGIVHQPKFVNRILVEDLLLITVLPRGGAGSQRIVIFSGTHAPATTASTGILDNPPFSLLSSIDAKVDIANNPYYQTLLRVQVTAAPDGSRIPGEITHIDSHPLDVRFD